MENKSEDHELIYELGSKKIKTDNTTQSIVERVPNEKSSEEAKLTNKIKAKITKKEAEKLQRAVFRLRKTNTINL